MRSRPKGFLLPDSHRRSRVGNPARGGRPQNLPPIRRPLPPTKPSEPPPHEPIRLRNSAISHRETVFPRDNFRSRMNFFASLPALTGAMLSFNGQILTRWRLLLSRSAWERWFSTTMNRRICHWSQATSSRCSRPLTFKYRRRNA